jgi:ribosomal protein S18 acetylase RimI-like enzyme
VGQTSAMGLVLRSYEVSDFERVYALDHECFPRGIAYSRRMLTYFLGMPQSSCIVAEDDGEIKAFIITEEEGPLGHILTLDVAESHRRLGLGTRLLARSEEELAGRGVREIVLETSVENAAGVAFWERHGFLKVGRLKRYYLQRIDAYEMRKNIAVSQAS